MGKTFDSESRVCRRCVDDPHLWTQAADEPSRGVCDFCGAKGPCVTVAILAAVIDPVYRENVHIGETTRVFAMDDDNDGWEQKGEDPLFIVQELTGLDVDIAEAVVEVLSEGDWSSVVDGGDALYDMASNYEYTPSYPHEHHEVWNTFQKRVKHRRRYLDRSLELSLNEIFSDFPVEWIERADGPVQHHGAGGLRIFRARAAADLSHVRAILADPHAQLGPPPRDSRAAGRLNAAGIGVFYGGLSSDVCVAETRPFLGSYAVVAEFEQIDTIKVLDLTAFDRHPPSGSLFRPGYADERDRWRFLQSFHWRITQPVKPGTESLEYVPTQVVAEYLHSVLGFDALIYRSAQVGIHDDEEEDPGETPLGLRNIVFFGASGLLEPAAAPEPVENTDALHTRFLGIVRDEEPARGTPVLRFSRVAPTVLRVTRITYESTWEYVSLRDDSDIRGEDSDVPLDDF